MRGAGGLPGRPHRAAVAAIARPTAVSRAALRTRLSASKSESGTAAARLPRRSHSARDRCRAHAGHRRAPVSDRQHDRQRRRLDRACQEASRVTFARSAKTYAPRSANARAARSGSSHVKTQRPPTAYPAVLRASAAGHRRVPRDVAGHRSTVTKRKARGRTLPRALSGVRSSVLRLRLRRRKRTLQVVLNQSPASDCDHELGDA